jgi:hypothetical protein
MKAILPGIFVLGLSILPTLMIPSESKAAERPVKILTEYFDLLISGNIESAHYLWTEPSLNRAGRFGIEYIGIPLKNDCTSPIIRDLKLMRHHLERPAKQTFTLDDSSYQRLLYSKVVEGKLVEYNYYMYFDGEYWWLCYPQDYYCRDWPTRESRYFRIHVDPTAERYLNPVALDAADEFVERIADSLKFSKDRMKTLETEKIEYYYCGNDSTVELISGHLVKGVFDMASNDLISGFFPHYHVLIHLLVNIKLQRLPLYTQPLLRKGVAVYYGGRWGKTPASLLGLGAFLYREDIVDLDSLLAMPLFESHSGADISYPVAGLFTAYLIDRMGRDRYLDLYLKLSGDFETVYSQTVPEVKQILVEAAKTDDWDKFLQGFDEYITEATGDKAVIRPGHLKKGKELARGDNYVVRAHKKWVGFEFSFEGNHPATGNLLFGHDDRLNGIGSILHGEQYGPETEIEGYRYGVRFDQNEVGLYDYATSHLMAKYIWGITPSDDYYDADNNKITVMFRKELLPKEWPSGDDVKLLPN